MESNASMNERIAEFARLVEALQAAQIPFLLVGGLSLSAHHYERTTQDIDFFCRKDLFALFDAVMKNLGYGHLHEPTDLYIRYSQSGRAIVDFIFADAPTFAQMEASAFMLTEPSSPRRDAMRTRRPRRSAGGKCFCA